MDAPVSHVTLYYGLKLADQYMRVGKPSRATQALSILRDAHGFDFVESLMVFWRFQEMSLKRPLL
ncbi:MAG: hypothetical protein EOP83_10790 [Verrucomicrobiaceae bacterium]|nr:MAG: hypothetical protein EOP83_10790 [Verrucomicrobiaceae bacterium]